MVDHWSISPSRRSRYLPSRMNDDRRASTRNRSTFIIIELINVLNVVFCSCTNARVEMTVKVTVYLYETYLKKIPVHTFCGIKNS